MAKISLVREISLWQAVLMGVGVILGAGIYVLVGKASALAGNAVWLSFLLSALVAVFTGLSYAELSSVFPKAGAEYVYTKHAFGRRMAFIIGWLLVISGFVFSATVALGFGGYFHNLFGVSPLLVAALLITLLSLVTFYGVKESVWFSIVFTLIEASGLFIIIGMGLPYLGSVDYFEFPSLAGVFKAAALIFFAYIGFEQITRLSEETKKADVNIPKALLIAIAITTVLYVLVALSAVSILDWRSLGESSAPLADVASQAFGENAFIILSIFALFATTNTVMLMLLATSRIIYGIGRSFSPQNLFARVHPKTHTPWVATIATMVFSILFLSFGKIETIANITDLLVFFTFVIINLSVIRIRYMNYDKFRDFKIPLNIGKFPIAPVLGVVSCLMLMVCMETKIMIYAVLLIITGFVVSEILERKGIKAKFE